MEYHAISIGAYYYHSVYGNSNLQRNFVLVQAKKKTPIILDPYFEWSIIFFMTPAVFTIQIYSIQYRMYDPCRIYHSDLFYSVPYLKYNIILYAAGVIEKTYYPWYAE